MVYLELLMFSAAFFAPITETDHMKSLGPCRLRARLLTVVGNEHSITFEIQTNFEISLFT